MYNLVICKYQYVNITFSGTHNYQNNNMVCRSISNDRFDNSAFPNSPPVRVHYQVGQDQTKAYTRSFSQNSISRHLLLHRVLLASNERLQNMMHYKRASDSLIQRRSIHHIESHRMSNTNPNKKLRMLLCAPEYGQFQSAQHAAPILLLAIVWFKLCYKSNQVGHIRGRGDLVSGTIM